MLNFWVYFTKMQPCLQSLTYLIARKSLNNFSNWKIRNNFTQIFRSRVQKEICLLHNIGNFD